MSIFGKNPADDWELALANTAEIRNRFTTRQIDDILHVITFAGQLPAWPS